MIPVLRGVPAKFARQRALEHTALGRRTPA
jgi:hypothetical protein